MDLKSLQAIDFTDKDNKYLVPIGISNKHLHVSAEDFAVLFGEGAKLTPKKDLIQPGQYAAEETVTLVGPKGRFDGIRILGPVRPETQVELSQTDCRILGINAPIRESGELGGSSSIRLIGPEGELTIEEGAIVALTHIHLSTAEGKNLSIDDKELVDVVFRGENKAGMLFGVLARVGDKYAMELHLDTDEANAFRVNNGDLALLVKKV